MLAKGNRCPQVTAACKKHGGFYLGSVGGPAARLAQDCIRKVEVFEYPELGMEAGEVAAGGSDVPGNRQEVVEGLLLDRVDAEAARATSRRQHHRIAFARSRALERSIKPVDLPGGGRREGCTRLLSSVCQCRVRTTLAGMAACTRR
jgi:hypothetical protein